MPLSSEIAEELAGLVLPSLHREYPNKIAHVLLSDGDARPPRELTPMFYGCFDWHSAVHSHYTLVRLVRLAPDPEAAWVAEVRRALAASFTAEKTRGELDYLGVKARHGFEMPYGMGWLLALCAELRAAREDAELGAHHRTLEPLERLAAGRFAGWLQRLPHPIRTGEHGNSAFGLSLLLDWARAAGDGELEAQARARAQALYAADRDGPLAYEPSAYDFFSPCLAEADLLARVLAPEPFSAWLSAFLPDIDLTPVTPLDRADGKLVHFDGLNLSRAWMLRRIAAALPPDDPRPPHLRHLAGTHERAGLDGVRTDHYAGTHWLATFALCALTWSRGSAPPASTGSV